MYKSFCLASGRGPIMAEEIKVYEKTRNYIGWDMGSRTGFMVVE